MRHVSSPTFDPIPFMECIRFRRWRRRFTISIDFSWDSWTTPQNVSRTFCSEFTSTSPMERLKIAARYRFATCPQQRKGSIYVCSHNTLIISHHVIHVYISSHLKFDQNEWKCRRKFVEENQAFYKPDTCWIKHESKAGPLVKIGYIYIIIKLWFALKSFCP